MTPESRRRRRFLIGSFIAVFWLVMTGLLVYRDVLGGSLRGEVVLGETSWIEEPVETWLTITTPASDESERRVGWARVRQAPETLDQMEGARMDAEVHLQLNLLGRSTELDMEGSVWRARRQRRAEIDFRVASGGAEFVLKGSILGDRLRAQIQSGGDSTPLDLRLPDNALFSTGFGTAFSFPRLEPGEQTVVQTFDPMTLRPTRSRVRAVSEETLDLAGERVRAVRLRVQTAGFETTAWIDDNGQVVRAETPLGLHLRMATREQALAPLGSEPNVGGLLRITAVRPTGERPFRGAVELVASLRSQDGRPVVADSSMDREAFTLLTEAPAESDSTSGNGPPSLYIPADYRQRVAGDGRIQLLAGDAPAVSEPTSAQLSDYLGADPFIASAHPRIVARASAILTEARVPDGDSPAARRARANALHDWTYRAIDKVPVLSLPSALEILENRRGDCNEHTILYTALARSVGLPTRVAIGLVWSDELAGFYYHAWPEVWLGDAWLALDPTLGQRVADATHLKLLEGGIERWPQLLPFLGNLEIELHSVK